LTINIIGKFLNNSLARPKSPCIGICSTGIGDSVCRGCKRFGHEVIAWNAYSSQEQWSVLQRMGALLEQVAQPIIEIVDKDKLKQELRYQNFRIDDSSNPYLWLIDLLAMGAKQLTSIESFGCKVRPEFTSMSFTDIKLLIEKDYYNLSVAHFDRYFSGTVVDV
jgi:hypothetical protein